MPDDPAAYSQSRAMEDIRGLLLPKSGHTINLEEPEAFNRALLDFLTAVDAGRWTFRNPASLSASAILPAERR